MVLLVAHQSITTPLIQIGPSEKYWKVSVDDLVGYTATTIKLVEHLQIQGTQYVNNNPAAHFSDSSKIKCNHRTVQNENPEKQHQSTNKKGSFLA